MQIIMPKMGESINEGTVIKWHKKVGDAVNRDEIIFEISTDKVDTEIPSPSNGILSEIFVHEGETVEVGTIVATLQTHDLSENEESVIRESRSENNINISMHDLIGQNIPHAAQIEREYIEIIMPKMGESVMDGTIIKWHKKVGEQVKKDEILFEISTDKVDTEIPSPEDGILSEILVSEQQTVEVGTIVAKLKSSTKSVTGYSQKNSDDLEGGSEQKTDEKNLELNENRKETADAAAKTKRFYSPLVLSIAQKQNVSFEELENIDGTGIAGRVTKKDILEYLEKRTLGRITKGKTETKHTYQPPAEPFENKAIPSSEGVQKIEMDNIRLKIMQHMVKSRDTSVHVTGLIEVDMSKVHNFIKVKKNELLQKENVKLTYMPFVAHAAIKAIKEFPLINSTIEGTTIYQKKFVNLGIAVALEPTGLIVPNIKNAEDKNIVGLAKSITDLANRARTKKLTPDDVSGGTFSITNYGVFGTLFGTPIINQPEVAILGVGAVQKKPVVLELDGVDTIAIKPIMAVTLSHDHRLIDGMLGGRFLKFVKDSLENFDGRIY
ncbi:MAG: 2-oxoglutarate dehydrogenase, E2 component, dihydrolipoamide succinyltransferase [Ignavibacteriaceae bacterium]|nr:2-oxoglutarate dehydrogenase, E2 component, dihydrolipoamide succinyltransferase [Ignavibacteriaceae bacterium]